MTQCGIIGGMTATAPRLIRRYGSRKLYDVEASRYVSLDELARLIEAGAEVQVVDRATGDDVTVQTLGQVIAEQGRRGRHLVAADLLQAAIREGEDAVQRGAREVRDGARRLVQRLGPVRRIRADVEQLRDRIHELEAMLTEASGAYDQPTRPDTGEEIHDGQEEEE